MGAPDRSTCQLTRLVVFGPGAHKDGQDFYSPARAARIPENFARLRGVVRPVLKIGHDRQERVAKRLALSTGFLNFGLVTRCDPIPGHPGYSEVDITGVPVRTIGGEINAGRLPGVSVELKPGHADPKNAAEWIEGPVLTAVAVLGEELPAVRDWPEELRRRAVPRATFPDGTPVPPNTEPPPEWMDAMAGVAAEVAARYGGEFSDGRATIRGRTYSAAAICFSDTFDPEAGPVDFEQMLAAAASLTPEQKAQLAAALAPAPVEPAPAPPAPPGQFAAFADEMKKCFADFKGDVDKRMGGVEKFADEAQKKAATAEDALMSEHVERQCAAMARKQAPWVVEKVHRPAMLGIAKAATFSTAADKVTAITDYAAPYLKLADDASLAPRPGAPVTGARLTPGYAELLNLVPEGAAIAKKYAG